MFLLDHAILTNADIKLNNLTFNWYDKIKPMFDTAQIKLLNEKELWINKVKVRRNRIHLKLHDYLNRVKDLRTKDKISEAELISKLLKTITADLAEISKEVSFKQNKNKKFY